MKNPDFAWAFAVRVFVLLAFNIPFAFQFFILTDFIKLSVEEANSTIGYLAIVSLAATLVGTAFSCWLSDRLDRRKLLIYISVAILVASYILPITMPDLTGITLYWIVNGVGYGVFVTVDAALMMGVLPSEGVDSGKELSILSIATALPHHPEHNYRLAPHHAVRRLQHALHRGRCPCRVWRHSDRGNQKVR